MGDNYKKSYRHPGDEQPSGPAVVPCPNCGNPLRPGSAVCGACGKRLDGTTAAPGANKALLLAAVGIVVMMGAGVAMFILARGSAPSPQATGPEPMLSIPKHEYDPGEEIRVRFTAPANYDKTAWIGIIPSNTPHGDEVQNDMHDLAYQYLQNMTSGEFIFMAPREPGDYDFRMHNTDSNGRETYSVSFVVRRTEPETEVRPGLALSKRKFKPGEEISVEFTAPSAFDSTAWVGIVPAKVSHGDESVNDQHDLSYRYLDKKTSGRLTFSAPFELGEYTVRMHDSDNNGREVASEPFSVTIEESEQDQVEPSNLDQPLVETQEEDDTQPELMIEEVEYKPGAQITVNFTAPASYPADAWVGIVPSDVEHGSETTNDQHDLAYQHLNKQTSGTLTFMAPMKAGEYDFRMNDSDRDGGETASVSFTVVEDSSESQ